jgi:hypothetical protein
MTRKDRENNGKVTCFQFILPGLIILLLLTSMTYAGELEKSAQPSDRPQAAAQISSSYNTARVGELPVLHIWQNNHQSPLAPVSAFDLQANLCKYLDTCPTPGATVSRDEPSDEELTDDGLM